MESPTVSPAQPPAQPILPPVEVKKLSLVESVIKSNKNYQVHLGSTLRYLTEEQILRLTPQHLLAIFPHTGADRAMAMAFYQDIHPPSPTQEPSHRRTLPTQTPHKILDSDNDYVLYLGDELSSLSNEQILRLTRQDFLDIFSEKAKYKALAMSFYRDIHPEEAEHSTCPTSRCPPGCLGCETAGVRQAVPK